MKTTTTLFVFLISVLSIMAQSKLQSYDSYIRKADSLYRANDFKNSSFAFTEAFKVRDAKITMNHQYNAACSYA